jgi:sulfatase maturation enzyme AslB (radical SAM superfamily)
MCTERIQMKNEKVSNNNAVELTEAPVETPAASPENTVPEGSRTTSTGRPTLVGTRQCTECGRKEFHTKKFEKSGDENDLNQRYTLCKGVCVYCYAQKRNKSTGSSLTVPQLEAKIKFYTDLLAAKQAPVAENAEVVAA